MKNVESLAVVERKRERTLTSSVLVFRIQNNNNKSKVMHR